MEKDEYYEEKQIGLTTYYRLHPAFDWQDDGRITELNNYIVGLREAMARQQQQSSANCAISDVSISLPSDEEIREPIQNALYSTDRLTTDQCTELADGILTYLTEAGYKVVRQ